MPNENPPPQSFFAEFATVIHALSLYGAAGIAAFGWAMAWLMGVDAGRWLPLWFCAALVIYNADRIRRDPADVLNVPARAAASARLRTVGGVTLGLAALVLVGLPAWRRDWLTLALVLGGSVVCLGYSIPVLGVRWKDVPLVKTLFAPTIVTAAIFGLIFRGEISIVPGVATLPQGGDLFRLLHRLTFLVPWAWCYLLFNMVLCDLRDLAGDRQCGIRSIPVVWGERGARGLLWALAVMGQAMLVVLLAGDDPAAVVLTFVSLITGCYQAWLLHATRRPRSERFYEWAVEGMLFLPMVAFGLATLFYRFVHDSV